MSLKITGLEDVQRRLSDLQNRAQSLSGSHSVRFDELFSPVFMNEHTDFTSIDEMVSASGFKVDSAEDFKNIPDAAWKQFVVARTRFTSWDEMMAMAGREWAARRLGF